MILAADDVPFPAQSPIETAARKDRLCGAAPLGPYRELNRRELATFRRTHDKWIWKGLVAPGSVTLLTAQWGWGKTTLISALLTRLGSGGELAGRPVAAGRALVISDEGPEIWDERSQVFQFGDHVTWICQPFLSKPTFEEWQALLDQIVRSHEHRKLQLVVIDTLAVLGPMRSENESGEMLKALLPLRALTKLGIAVIILHHPRKGRLLPGQAARGSGALPGFVDVLVEMRLMSLRNPLDRRRRLRAYSRYTETPSNWVIELNAEGIDYTSLGSDGAPDFQESWPILRGILEKASGPLTREDIRRQWPPDRIRPSESTLMRWMDKLVREEEVLCEGMGVKKDPHRYSLPGMEATWQGRQMELLHKKLGLPPPKWR